ncbi:lasso peptide biosynthesis B2 protein [Aerophototrophica crusticola]|uniref:Lasso peptide biosynthesis B2 protein n=1 Tax=Aerophototrophica crusticola TaxID=1709002 RepID=A0A858R6U3_9PROT|nr:lasso peptide biosynthesis B2 protein [Rhodospirillaceae bacterium B3]
MRKLRRLLDVTGADRRLLAEAVGELARARARILLGHLMRRKPDLGRLHGETGERLSPAQEREVARIRWAVRAAARHVPWNAVCLPRAMAAKAMLRRRGIGSTLYLGVALRPEPGVQGRAAAHAWLRAGAVVLTGEEHMDQYTCIAKFS